MAPHPDAVESLQSFASVTTAPQSFASVTTTDVDQAQSEVGSLFCPHRLQPTDGTPLRMTLRARKLGGVGLVHLDYGAGVRIDPGALQTFYLVQLPRTGTASIRHGHEEIVSSPTVASVLSPDEDVSMTWHAGNPQDIVYVERATMEARLSRLLDRPITTPVRFDLGMPIDVPAVASWRRGVDFFRDEVSHASPFLDDPSFVGQVEEMVVDRLLLSQRHNYSDQLAGTGAAVHRVIARARNLIRDHHAEPLTVADVAEAVGVSVRGLQDGFRRDLDTTPTAYLRHCRLVAAHRDLCDDDGRSVATVATAHGFTHLGRFSADYRRLFGRPPSATLRTGELGRGAD